MKFPFSPFFSAPDKPSPYDLFVYGSKIMMLAMNSDSRETAHTWGRLQASGSILEIAPGFARCEASGNTLDDARTLQSANTSFGPCIEPKGNGWKMLSGVLLRFEDPAWKVPPVERLLRTGHPKGAGYLAMIPITKRRGPAVWAWCFVKRSEAR